MAYYSRKNKNIMLSFLAGTAVGTGLALLTAPKSGKEMRQQISDMTDDSMTKIKGYASDAQSKLSDTMESGKRMFREKKTYISSAIQGGKEAVSEEREKQRGSYPMDERSAI